MTIAAVGPGRAEARWADRGGEQVRPLPTVGIGMIGGLIVGMTSVGAGSLMIVLLLFLYPLISANALVGTDLTQAVPLTAAAALGALGLAVGAIVHSLSATTTGQHQRLLLVALVAWPVITGVPAFLVGLGASGLLARLSRRDHGE